MQVNESKHSATVKGIELIAAILVKSRADLLRQIDLVRPYLKAVQIDIMDGIFVPNKTIGLEELKKLPSGINYEFHWMVQSPEKWILKLAESFKGGLHLVHIESKMDFEKVKEAVAAIGGKLGIAFNPETPLEKIFPYENETSYFLAMTVHPGFSGQRYINEAEEKIRVLRERHSDYDIEVDGGINLETIKRAVSAGANRIVAASAIFSQENVAIAIKELQRAAVSGRKAWLE